MAIFSDMVEKFIEVFMDDFSIKHLIIVFQILQKSYNTVWRQI